MNTFKLLDGIKWDRSYKDVLRFQSIEDQSAYMDAHASVTLYEEANDFKFIRPNQQVKVTLEYTRLIGFKYCSFTNTVNGISKTFYAFITSIEFLNPSVTALNIEIDLMQTYQFDHALGESYIDREHQPRAIGSNRVFNTNDEGLDVGKDLVTVADHPIRDRTISNGFNVIPIMIVASESLSSTTEASLESDESFSSRFGVPSVLKVYITFSDLDRPNRRFYLQAGGSLGNLPLFRFDELSVKLANDPKVLSITPLPYSPIAFTFTASSDPDAPVYIAPSSKALPIRKDDVFGVGQHLHLLFIYNSDTVFTIAGGRAIDFIPKVSLVPPFQVVTTPATPRIITNESKLYTQPFNVFKVFNNYGNVLELPIHEMTGNQVNFKFNVSANATPKSILKIENIPLAFPELISNQLNDLPLKNDAYLNYLATSKASAISNVAVPLGSLAIGVLASAVPGGQGVGLPMIISGIGSASAQIGQDLARRQDLKNTPDTVRQSGNDVTFDLVTDFFFYRLRHYRIRPQYYSRAYEFLHRFGYKSQRFGVPLTTGRYYFNYIKTADTRIDANLNGEIVDAIRDVYENGVTLWHYRNNESELFRFDLENFESED